MHNQGRKRKRMPGRVRSVVLGILFHTTISLGQWSNPVLLPPPINVNPPGDYYYSAISADGQTLCITIPGTYGDDDVYFSQRIGDSAWTVPINAGPNVNNAQRNLSPSVTTDRQRLYYVSYTGSYDILVSHRTGQNWYDWSPGVPLPQPINRGLEFTATISGDDSTLVFSSTGYPGYEGLDVLLESRLQPDGSWNTPLLIGPYPNPYYGGLHPCLTDSGRTLLYAQWRGLIQETYYSTRNDTGFSVGVPCDSTINNGSIWNSGPSAPWDGSFLFFERRDTAYSGAVARLYKAPRVMTSVPHYSYSPLPQQGSIQIYPNPFNATTVISFAVPKESRVTLTTYDVLGRVAETIADRVYAAGEHQVAWNCDGCASGVYVIRMKAGGMEEAKKVVRLK